ncbi:MAG: site-specific integrase [Bacteroidota bacterium]
MATKYFESVITNVTDNGKAVNNPYHNTKMYTVKQIIHKGQNRIAVGFANKPELIERFKKLAGKQWSQSLKTWHLPDTKENRDRFGIKPENKTTEKETPKLSEHLLSETNSVGQEPLSETKQNEKTQPSELVSKAPFTKDTAKNLNPIPPSNCNVFIEVIGKQIKVKLPKNEVDTKFITSFMYCRWDKKNYVWIIPNWKNNLDKLNIYFDKRIKELETKEIKQEKDIKTSQFEKEKKENTTPSQIIKSLNHPNKILPSTHNKAIEKYTELLRLENYSANTINTYKNWFTLFLRCFPKHNPNEITKQEIIEMLVRYRNNKKWSATGQNQLISSIKFFYEKVLKRKREIYDFPRAEKPYQLPTIFDESEIIALFNACENLKHKTILMLAYSGGLRVSELVNLKIVDIDSKRMVITLRQAKGKKDRQVMLSEKLLLLFRNYFREYKPKEYLFEGQAGGIYTSRSIELIIKQAKKKAGITKKGSIHAMRHSFATHLLEGGTDIMSIKELLGHSSIQTTSIYTHVSKKQLSKIQSPLDKLI